MPTGIQYAAADINSQLGQQMLQLKVVLDRLHSLHAWYLALGAGGLTNAPYSMAAADDATIGSALSDADQLYQLFHNSGTLAVAKDFTTFMGRIWGIGY